MVRNGSVYTTARTASSRLKLQIKLAITLYQCTLTASQPAQHCPHVRQSSSRWPVLKLPVRPSRGLSASPPPPPPLPPPHDYLFVGCLTPQQQASVSQGRTCSDNFTCFHTDIEAADQTFYLTQSQYTDTGPTSPSADLVTPGAWQGSQCSANF